MPDRESEEIDDFIDMRSDEMSAKNSIRFFLDEDLEGVDSFRRLSCGEPIRSFLVVLAKLETSLRASRSLKRTAAIGGIVKATLGTPR